VVGNRVILRLLAAGREVRAIVRSSTRAAEMRAILDAGQDRPDARVSFIASDRDDDAERLDAVAGCEFVDDRIRLLY
jgi:dihydroflavonol-4-reductase